MKVIYDLQAYTFAPYGGIVAMFNESIARFSEKKNFNALLYAPARIAGQPPAAPNIRTSPWRALPGPLQPYRSARAIYKMADKLYWTLERGDIFHPTFYPEHSELFKLKSVVNVYDLTHEKIEKPDDMPDHTAFKQIKRNALQKASRIICISETTKNDLFQFYNINPDIVRVVHLACNPIFRIMDANSTDSIVKKLLGNSEKPFFLYIGSRQAYKNFDRLLEAYQQWPMNKDVSFVVIGGGMPSAGTGKGDVRFIGYVDDAALCALYNKALFFAYPSLNEGFGIPLLEAMASNCPVCASDIPVFREIAGNAIHYFDPYSVDSIISTLDNTANEHKKQTLREARQNCIKQYSWDICAEKIWKIYEELV